MITIGVNDSLTMEHTRLGQKKIGFFACTTVLSAAMSVSGRIRAVEVHILTAHEATVSVLCMQLGCCDAVPGVAHSCLDVPFRERTVSEDALPPKVEEGVVERREALG